MVSCPGCGEGGYEAGWSGGEEQLNDRYEGDAVVVGVRKYLMRLGQISK